MLMMGLVMSRLEQERLQISSASKGIMVYAKLGKQTEGDRYE